MSRLEARERLVQHVMNALNEGWKAGHQDDRAEGEVKKKPERTSPSNHYYIGKSSRNLIDLTVWLGSHLEDRATTVSDF
jgi:hypothetical protein